MHLLVEDGLSTEEPVFVGCWRKHKHLTSLPPCCRSRVIQVSPGALAAYSPLVSMPENSTLSCQPLIHRGATTLGNPLLALRICRELTPCPSLSQTRAMLPGFAGQLR